MNRDDSSNVCCMLLSFDMEDGMAPALLTTEQYGNLHADYGLHIWYLHAFASHSTAGFGLVLILRPSSAKISRSVAASVVTIARSLVQCRAIYATMGCVGFASARWAVAFVGLAP